MICGATYVRYVHDARASVSMPHAALWVVQQGFVPILISRDHSFNAARGFVGGAASIVEPRKERKFVSMPHAALWVVQHLVYVPHGFRGFVSMPHAALWVVQLRRSQPLSP